VRMPISRYTPFHTASYFFSEQIITWKATDDATYEKFTKKNHKLDAVEQNTCRSWTENFQLGPEKYENTDNCAIIHIRYELEVVLDAKGSDNNLDIRIPVIIGDIPYGD